MGLEVGGLLGFIWLVIVIWAILRTAQSPAGNLEKALWIVILLVLPVLGLILWFLLGPK
ncbi:PLDc N-terminal domain-containing protein [Natronospira bacteriovora]|uniref:PLDc N-terminal domain-containing protein n=1 Tax=Natronospira bacteriovora TaxID=3069753 RepID=A0ABU0WA58_9GAMM|nr:PLDc N-terminal domain-containing protein [Natronospira sp. AB-CW4]MDQ2070881.1 PLDc N-terminal domain-containing protein [Natronospira sp. AB-CW4]